MRYTDAVAIFEGTMRHSTHNRLLSRCMLCVILLLADNALAETLRQTDSPPHGTYRYGRNSPYNAEYFTRYLRAQRNEQSQPGNTAADPAMPSFADRPASSGRRTIGGDQAFWNNGRAPKVNPQYEQGFKERYQQMMQGQAPAQANTETSEPPAEE